MIAQAGIRLLTLITAAVTASLQPGLASAQAANFSSLHDRLAAIYAAIPTEAGKSNFLLQSNNLTKPVNPRLVDLDSQIISCAPNLDSLLTSPPQSGPSCSGASTPLPTVAGMFLGGQCCGAMTDLKEYGEELAYLQKYKDILDIPLNPFKTSIAIAKKWIDYDNKNKLSSQEQATHDQAMDMSKEKPCCCQCWHYFVNEGIAKLMIRERHFTARDVADYWDNSSICGV